MASYLPHHMEPILEPLKFAAGRGWEDCDFTILALITVLRYCFATESETSCSVVW
jgi:hypothetical protein